jgi:hypothetical protein
MSEHLDRAKRCHEAIRGILLGEQDPIGIADEPAAQDEDDGYVHEIHVMLIRHHPGIVCLIISSGLRPSPWGCSATVNRPRRSRTG